MLQSSEPRTLYVLDPGACVRLDGEALRVSRSDAADVLVPLRRVGRAVIQSGENDLLQACMAILSRGGIVHFHDGAGRLCGVLQNPAKEGSNWAMDLACRIDDNSGVAPYRRWLDTQQRHAWSLVFRRGFTASFEYNRQRLVKYLIHYRPEIDLEAESAWLEDQLLSWTQSSFHTEGLYPIVHASFRKGKYIIRDLQPCLMIPLLWKYVRWRKHARSALVSDRTGFFEMMAAASLRDQFERHMHALDSHYSRISFSSGTPPAEHRVSLPGNRVFMP